MATRAEIQAAEVPKPHSVLTRFRTIAAHIPVLGKLFPKEWQQVIAEPIRRYARAMVLDNRYLDAYLLFQDVLLDRTGDIQLINGTIWRTLREAIPFCEQEKPDVIILQSHMLTQPELSNPADAGNLIARLRELLPSVRIFLYSAPPDPENYQLRGLYPFFDGYYGPDQFVDLKNAIRQVNVDGNGNGRSDGK